MTEMIDLREGAMLPDAILTAVVSHGASKGAWLEAMGTLKDVTVRLSGSDGGESRTLPGEWMAVSLRGVARVDSLKLMIVLSRQGVLGPEMVAGELASATVKKLTLRIERLGELGSEAPHQESAQTRTADASALFASKAPVSPTPSALPAKPVRPATSAPESIFPEPGDTVDHFAFGTCEVLKSDGDRLHLRQKDGRVKEIALAMLRVEPVDIEGSSGRKFRLIRKV